MYVEDVDDYVVDVLQHTADVKANNRGVPAFIYGHSMGGMVAVRTVMKNQAFYKVKQVRSTISWRESTFF